MISNTFRCRYEVFSSQEITFELTFWSKVSSSEILRSLMLTFELTGTNLRTGVEPEYLSVVVVIASQITYIQDFFTAEIQRVC